MKTTVDRFRSSLTRPGRSTLLGVFLLVALLLGAANLKAATLVSDQDDYYPGQTAYLFGTGFQAGEAVGVTVALHYEDGTIIDYVVGGVYADSEGNFVAGWLVPQEALNTSIEATAIGIDSALVATANFTDGTKPNDNAAFNVNFYTTGLPAGTTVTVSWTKINNGNNNQITGSTTFQAPAAVSDEGTQPSSPFTCSFPASLTSETGDNYTLSSLTVVGENYSLTSPSQVSFTTGAAGEKAEVVAAYAKVVTEPKVTPTPCPENQAPTLTAQDYDLGNMYATWNGSALTLIVPALTPDKFNAQASDPDKDDVAVSLNVDTVTLTGLGHVEAEVVLTATDNPSPRNVQGCPALQSKSTQLTVKVKANLIFQFNGFFSPLNNATATMAKKGSTVPAKFRLTDAGGTEITQLATLPTITVAIVSGVAPAIDPTVSDSGASNDNTASFRYSLTDGWIYNLSTKTGYTSGCTYKVTASLPDGTAHDVRISIK